MPQKIAPTAYLEIVYGGKTIAFLEAYNVPRIDDSIVVRFKEGPKALWITNVVWQEPKEDDRQLCRDYIALFVRDPTT